jgi:hypothetical protein
MFNIKIKDSAVSTKKAEVDDNKNLKIIPSNEGFVNISTEISYGDVLGYPLYRDPEVSNDYRLRAGLDNLLFNEQFASATLNTSVWQTPATTLTGVITAGWMVLNSGLSAATNLNIQLQSWRQFTCIGSFGIYMDVKAALTQFPVANNVIEIGMGICTARTAPSDGAFFRLNALGEFRCVLIYNSIEITSPPIDFSRIGVGIARHFRLNIEADSASFWLDSVKVAELSRHKAAGAVSSSSSFPFVARIYNQALCHAAQALKIGQVSISLADANMTKTWAHAMAGSGSMAYQNATGMTVGQTAQGLTSTNPAAAPPTATTAALGSGLGGVFLATIDALAVTTDYIISSYQVVADTATVPGRLLYITGVRFNCVNMGAANGAAIKSWVVGANFGLTAVTQATAEGAAAKAFRRIHLGSQSLPASAPIGTPASPDIYLDLSYAPIIVQEGEFIQTFLRFTNYAATTSQALWCYVTFIGYWE